MIDHFDKFKTSNHKDANKFKFLDNTDILSLEKMSDYLTINFPTEVTHKCGIAISDLVIGEQYTIQFISTLFGTSDRGRMLKSNKNNLLVLIVNHRKPQYDDQWTEDGILNYVGMGEIGNQSLDYRQNKTLRNSAINGVKVYLFESFKVNEYYYDGEVTLKGNPFQEEALDGQNNLRLVWKFPLVRVDGNAGAVVDAADLANLEENKKEEVGKKTNEEIALKAKAINPNKVTLTTTKVIQRNRNHYVEAHTKNRANGHCDLCGEVAPFKANDKPYLECHHVITLAEGGPDTIYNTVALCPNCHRKMHILALKEDKKVLVDKIKYYLESDDDKENLAEFVKLDF